MEKFIRTRNAAEQGDASAQNNLGRMYEYGREVPKDEVQAVAWYHRAAEQGEARAQYTLIHPPRLCVETGLSEHALKHITSATKRVAFRLGIYSVATATYFRDLCRKLPQP